MSSGPPRKNRSGDDGSHEPPMPRMPDYEPKPDDEQAYLEIVIQLRQIDPSLSPDGSASEATRNAINKLGRAPAPREDRAETPDPEAGQNDRTRQLASDISAELEESLSKLAAEWKTATETLLLHAGAASLAKLMQLGQDARETAETMQAAAFRGLIKLWQKYGLSDVELVKEVQKHAVKAAIIYAVAKATGLF